MSGNRDKRRRSSNGRDPYGLQNELVSSQNERVLNSSNVTQYIPEPIYPPAAPFPFQNYLDRPLSDTNVARETPLPAGQNSRGNTPMNSMNGTSPPQKTIPDNTPIAPQTQNLIDNSYESERAIQSEQELNPFQKLLNFTTGGNSNDETETSSPAPPKESRSMSFSSSEYSDDSTNDGESDSFDLGTASKSQETGRNVMSPVSSRSSEDDSTDTDESDVFDLDEENDTEKEAPAEIKGTSIFSSILPSPSLDATPIMNFVNKIKGNEDSPSEPLKEKSTEKEETKEVVKNAPKAVVISTQVEVPQKVEPPVTASSRENSPLRSSSTTEQQNQQAEKTESKTNSQRTVRATNRAVNLSQMTDSQKILQKSIKLNVDRRDSISLFAKPSQTNDKASDDFQMNQGEQNKDGKIKGVTIHESRTEDNEEIELDYEGSIRSNNVDPEQSKGFVNGSFSSGKLKEIETSAECFSIKFNLDSSILAVALKDGHGVELYETHSFKLIYTIERSCTVSALDWIEESDFDDEYDKGSKKERPQLLAVGGFDGMVKIYSISLERRDFIYLLDTFHVQTEICSMAFLKDSATNFTPNPTAIAIGEKSGKISIVTLSGYSSMSKRSTMPKVIEQSESAVLSITFGFTALSREKNGIIMVYGTKYGKLRVSLLLTNEGGWIMSHPLFDLDRTGAIRALRFNHDSSLLIVGGYDKTVMIIDADIWRVVRELYMDGTVQTIEFDPYNRYLLLGNRSRTLTVVDTSTLHPIKVFHTEGWVTSVSWGGRSTIAIRSAEREVSLVLFEAIQPYDTCLESTRDEHCSMSWSGDGRFLARTKDNDVLVSDSRQKFDTIARLSHVTRSADGDMYTCVKFCHARGKRDRLATITHDGWLRVVSIRVSVGKIHQELIAAVYIEKNLKSVAWTPDGSKIICGGRETKLHIIDATSFTKCNEAIDVHGRIWMIESLSQIAYDEVGDYASSFAVAVSSGKNSCSIIDLNASSISMEITRKRTVRCQTYHPSLPVLAIGDGNNEVLIVDLVGERKLASFFVDGRVNTIAFSPAGEYIAVGTDEGTFTLHDTETFACVQEIRSSSIAMSVEFSGDSSQYLTILHANGTIQIIKLGPLLSIDYTPMHGRLNMPKWAKNEVMYRSPEGPSFLQRCMLEGSKESLNCAEWVLDEAPESVLTFDRTTGIGTFETAVELRKPNIMSMILTPVVDGTLDTRSQWSSSLLTTSMPIDGFLTLRDLVLNHPPGYATDILSKMTFMKVPFAQPRRCHPNDPKECGSATSGDPWSTNSMSLQREDSMYMKSSRFSKENKDDIILIPACLPIPGLGTLDFLSALLSMPNVGSEIFDNDAMGIVLVVLWDAGIKYYFYIDFLMNIVFSASWIHFVDRTAESTSTGSNNPLVVTSLAWTVILINSIFLSKQAVRFYTRRGHFFSSKWHIIEFVCIVLVFSYCGYVLMVDNGMDQSFWLMSTHGKGNVPLAVVTTLFLTAKFVSMLRGFRVTGYLVAFLFQSFLDVRGFVVVIVSILMGFTVAFRLLLAQVPGECKVVLEDGNILSNDCDGDPFGNLARSVLSTFELTILGSYESDILYEARETLLLSIVFVTAVTVVLVIALNALIAVLGDSFSRVQENVSATRQRERAELIVEYLSMMPNVHRKRIESNNQYFHALLDSDGHGDLLRFRYDWQGGLNALKKELTDMTESNNLMTQRAIDQLRRDMTEEFGSMLQNEVTSVLNNVFLELKEISKFRQSSMRTRKVVNAAQKVAKIGGHGGTRIGRIRDSRSFDSVDESEEGEEHESVFLSL